MWRDGLLETGQAAGLLARLAHRVWGDRAAGYVEMYRGLRPELVQS